MASEEATPSRPAWLDDDFLKVCIANDTGARSEDISIADVKMQYVVKKGENYLSVLYRAVVRATLGRGGAEQVKRYVVKVPNSATDIGLQFREMGLFEKELSMYRTYLREFEEILREAGLEAAIGCRAVHFQPNTDVFVMEDLGAKGYRVCKRTEGTDLEHAMQALLKLARLHGASFLFMEQNSMESLPEHLVEPYIRANQENAWVNPKQCEANLEELAKDTRKRPGYEKEADIFERLKHISYDLIIRSFQYTPGSIFNTLTHGDCWINNIMFKYDDKGRPVDAVLIDLQCVCYNSIANELLYFLVTSMSDDIRNNAFSQLIKFYHDNLIETLEKVGYRGVKPTLEQLHQEILAQSISLFHLLPNLAVLRSEFSGDVLDRSKAETATFEELLETVKENRNNPRYLDCLFLTLDMFRECGIIEHFEGILEGRILPLGESFNNNVSDIKENGIIVK